MNVYRLQVVLFLNILYVLVSHSKRRIQSGETVKEDKAFMVYLIKAPVSKPTYPHWLCGGALVSTQLILTSRSCLEDVEFIYAIAGYNKYIPDDQIDTDPCTREKKKRVVSFYVQGGLTFDPNTVQGWGQADVALAKVESEYDFHDDSYKKLCSYIPTSVRVNFLTEFQGPGTEAYALGWGHTDVWRMHFDKTDYNQQYLKYVRIKLIDGEVCTPYYDKLNMSVKGGHFLCSVGETPQIINYNQPKFVKRNKCTTDNCTVSTSEFNQSDDEEIIKILDINGRRSLRNEKHVPVQNRGFCQNDHGGPLITWAGAFEHVIGVATIFRVSNHSNCEGPYLFTSTTCYSPLIHCILSLGTTGHLNSTLQMCDNPIYPKDYKITQIFRDWPDENTNLRHSEDYDGYRRRQKNAIKKNDNLDISDTVVL